ncbi:hypothetical protein CPB86DRAFT_273302 [Serendipita vermifera]|nr:hypothetical protein CPB86DRAFT_273302 [Serendipita vermifera]
MTQAAPIHDSNNKSTLLTASSAHQSSLWRKPTFGSSTGKASVQENGLTTSYDDHTVRSTASTSEYGTARASDNQSLHHYTSSSEDHHSFHSAFEHSSQMPGVNGSNRTTDDQNPFADDNASSSQVTLTTIKGGALRPDTATSSGKASIVSSVINPQFGRDLSLSPDPKELFYRAPGTGQSQASSNGSLVRISEDSRRSSDGASTIRGSIGSRFAYPSLQQVIERNEGPSATKH